MADAPIPPLAAKPPRPPAARGAARRIADQFLPDALEVERRAPPLVLYVTLYSQIGLIAAAFLWAAFAEVDRVVVAPGKLVTTAHTIVMQPMETAVVRSIDVDVGETVRQGQRLATLDPTFSQADVGQAQAKLQSFQARVARLEAELAGRLFTADADANSNVLLEGAVAASRRAQFEARIRGFAEEASRVEASLLTQREDVKVLGNRLAVLREIEAMRTSLQQREAGTRMSVLDAQNARLEVERDLRLATNRIKELDHQLARVKADEEAFVREWHQKTAEDLVISRREREGLLDELRKAERRLEMVALSAPQDAVVLEIARRSVGSVIRQAEPLLVLVPLNVPLEVEARVPADEIGFVRVGNEVRIKLEAFPFQKHGTALGRVRTISEDTFAPSEGEGAPPGRSAGGIDKLYYKTRVSIDTAALRGLPKDFRFISGMTLAAEINVGKRTVLSYFLYPLLRGLDEGIREP